MYERDQCRQKSEITLPSSKPNVQEILWKSLEIRNLDTKMGQDGVKLSGEVLISVLYQEEEEQTACSGMRRYSIGLRCGM